MPWTTVSVQRSQSVRISCDHHVSERALAGNMQPMYSYEVLLLVNTVAMKTGNGVWQVATLLSGVIRSQLD